MSDRAHIPQEDLALYAMHSLSAEESAEVRAHVDDCAECSAELAELLSDLALVAMSVEQHPVPAGARERLMEKVAADAAAEGRKPATVTSISDVPPPRRVYSSIQWAAVAAMIVFSFALLLKNGSLNQELHKQKLLAEHQAAESARAQQVLDVLTAKASQHVLLTSGKARPEPTGRAVYLASSGSLIFQANNLDPLPQGKTYELWVIPADGKAPIPAGLFRPNAVGSASVILPPLPTGVPAKAFGVTVERAQGSDTPTAPILLAGAPAPGE